MRSAGVSQNIPAALQKFRAPEAKEKILAAVSGGLDSMALLHLLKQFSATHRWKLTVAHFNHHLRGEASNADEAFVRQTAATMDLPFVVGGADVKKFAKESTLSIEMAARKLRHEFFARMARERKIKTVALAHHADDQVELFFLRLLRGAAGSLRGMKWCSPSPADAAISLARPLLNVTRAELEEFVRANKIRYRTDVSNTSLDFLRNRIRHELLPLLRRHYQPGLNKAILRLMEISGAETDLAAEIAQNWTDASTTGTIRSKGEFENLPAAVQRHVLKSQLAGHGIAADFDLIESLRRSPNQFINVTASIFISRDAKGTVHLREQRIAEFDNRKLVVNVGKVGRIAFAGAKLKWQFSSRLKEKKSPGQPGTEFFDADKVGSQVVLRHWRPGDRFQPIGLKTATKLQDLFTNNKISRERRHKLILAETKEEIFWVEGLRISENFKLTPQTKRILVWNWRR
jgi:tRNA(Ile)-lysidine synthase